MCFIVYILFHLFPHVFMDHVETYLEKLAFPVLLPSLVPHQLPVIHIALWNGRCGRRYISNDQNKGQSSVNPSGTHRGDWGQW